MSRIRLSQRMRLQHDSSVPGECPGSGTITWLTNTAIPGALVSRSSLSSSGEVSSVDGGRTLMLEPKIGTRDEWQADRDELAKLEAEHAELGKKVTEQRRRLPWVRVEKQYTFDTESGKKTLADLFDGRSQLLAYNIMFGPDFKNGACPGCSNLGDELDPTRVHVNHHDVTLICFSRAPIDRLVAYKRRMGWTFPYVSTHGTDFPFDFGLALKPEQA